MCGSKLKGNKMTAIDVQLTKTYILDVPTTEWTDCATAITAIQAGDEVLCPQALGELTRSRDITEVSCMSSNDSVKAAGKMTYGDFTVEMLFDSQDAKGQKKLLDAFDNNTPVVVGVESPDTGGKSGTIIWTKAIVSGDAIAYPDGSKVGYTVTLAPFGGFNVCAPTA